MSMKNIAYPDADLSCGLSTDGILICGDKDSILKVQAALHDQMETVPVLRKYVLDLTSKIEKLEKRVSDYGWAAEAARERELASDDRYSWK